MDKETPKTNVVEEGTLPAARPDFVSASVPKPPAPAPHHFGRTAGLIFLCFIASFLGSWAFVSSGLVKLQSDDTITESRQRVIAEGEVVADVAETVSPSVVSIVTESVAESGFFGPTAQEGAGTGIIISSDGYVLTNKHVIPDGVRSVSVVLPTGKTYENVTVIGRDPLNDIAFLKIKDVSGLTAAKLGDSSTMEVGQKVVAIGNALGQFQTTVTSGILSGTGRPVTASDGTFAGTEQLENLFQTDAAINPGNSGGPLVNLNGEVIGINTAVAEDAEGIGFAIPINDAKGLIKGVLEKGEITRAYLGVRYIMLNPEVAKELNTKQEKGAYVGGSTSAAILGGSPADKAGLKEGDVILKVNNTELTERVTLVGQISQFAPGDQVELLVLRDGRELKLKVTLEKLES